MFDGVYELSLDIAQYVDLGLKIGSDYSEEDVARLKQESEFGKIYSKSLEYCLMRPRSVKEMKEYFYRKIFRMNLKSDHESSDTTIVERILNKLIEKGYVDDYKFACYWVENRRLKKGISRKRLILELRGKGVEDCIIERCLEGSLRSDIDELEKIIEKKKSLYADQNKLIQYLIRQGFRCDDIKCLIDVNDD